MSDGAQHADQSADTDGFSVAPLTPALVEEASRVLSHAFLAEPITSGIFDLSDSSTRRLHDRAMRLQLGGAVKDGDPVFVAVAGGRVIGVATVARIRLRSVARSIRAWARLLPRAQRGALRIALAARPSRLAPRPYLLLEAIGVSPDEEGRGVGRALLTRVLERCDAEQGCKGVYLQTAGDRSRRIYERAGFEVLEERTADGMTVAHMFRPRAVDERG